MVSAIHHKIAKLSVVLMALCIALSMSSNALAAYGTDFLDALDAYEEGDYQKAVTKLEKAIKGKKNAGLDQRFYGMVYGNYIPYFYLGQARYKLGDCEGALEAWKESQKQGVISGLSENSEMQVGITACAGEAVDIPKLAGEATREIDKAKSRATQLQALSSDFRSLGSSQLYQREWVARWEPTLNAAQQSAGDMESRLATAVNAKDDAAIDIIKSEAIALADSLVGSMTQATNQIAAIRQQQETRVVDARNKARRELAQAVASARSQGSVKANKEVAGVYSSLMELADSGEGLSADTSVEEQLQLAQRINTALRRYQMSVQDWRRAEENIAHRTPPAELKLVVTEYLAGNYEKTIQLVDPASFDDERAQIQALLFRAAASYQLYMLSGEQTSQDLQRAEDDIRQIKGLNKKFSPYIPVFSPKFLDLFRRSG